MSEPKNEDHVLSELQKRAMIDAKEFFSPLVADERVSLTNTEVNGNVANITVQSSVGKRITLQYDTTSRRLLNRP